MWLRYHCELADSRSRCLAWMTSAPCELWPIHMLIYVTILRNVKVKGRSELAHKQFISSCKSVCLTTDKVCESSHETISSVSLTGWDNDSKVTGLHFFNVPFLKVEGFEALLRMMGLGINWRVIRYSKFNSVNLFGPVPTVLKQNSGVLYRPPPLPSYQRAHTNEPNGVFGFYLRAHPSNDLKGKIHRTIRYVRFPEFTCSRSTIISIARRLLPDNTSNGFCLTLSEVWKLPMVFVLLSVKYRDFQWFLSYSQWSMETSDGFCLTLSEVWTLPMVFVLLSVKYGNFQWFLSYSQWSMDTSNGFCLTLSEVWKLPMVFVLLSVKYGHFQWFLSYSQWSMETSNGFCLTLSEV